jgi:hypothetical protein
VKGLPVDGVEGSNARPGVMFPEVLSIRGKMAKTSELSGNVMGVVVIAPTCREQMLAGKKGTVGRVKDSGSRKADAMWSHWMFNCTSHGRSSTGRPSS